MHATIRRYENKGAAISPDELVQMGREIAAHLGDKQGFVSLLILDSSPELQGPISKQNQVLAMVSIFENQVGLKQADRLSAAPLEKRLAAEWQEQAQVTTGEIVFQRGL